MVLMVLMVVVQKDCALMVFSSLVQREHRRGNADCAL
jgi:hypothetical protein